MNIEKLKEWMEFAQSYGEGDYWEQLFDAKSDSLGKKRTEKVEYPKVDVYQSNTEITVVAEVPGLRKEELSLSVSGNILRIRSNPGRGPYFGTTVQSERYNGSYDREIQLPSSVEGPAISAGLADGLLTIRFRKAGRREEPIFLE
ncbi:Hsp20 family protein [Cohnella sp. CFH 77786]|uniref:Hsp20/alpha crystallin family protein n=1 Tax=Cohnella sp. CFH 77786 TaxID=2662265 RepID=UPI001C608FBA|nr:Hsp20/alpha crystallin family protein [Cohnella sp. CFH 77786]MBW5446370.1 Hsp20 family protein [Cohnella sp. CFH 77786]